jgi:hypothetical protein
MTLLALLALILGMSLAKLLRRPIPPLRHPWVLLFSPLPEVLAAFTPLPTLLAQGLTYTLVALGAALNLHLWGMYFLLLGALLNATAILLCGGMSVDPVALDKAGLSAYRDFLLHQKDGLHYLGPAFPLGDWIPLPGRTVSPGDLVIALGLFLIPVLGKRRINHAPRTRA